MGKIYKGPTRMDATLAGRPGGRGRAYTYMRAYPCGCQVVRECHVEAGERCHVEAGERCHVEAGERCHVEV